MEVSESPEMCGIYEKIIKNLKLLYTKQHFKSIEFVNIQVILPSPSNSWHRASMVSVALVQDHPLRRHLRMCVETINMLPVVGAGALLLQQ